MRKYKITTQEWHSDEANLHLAVSWERTEGQLPLMGFVTIARSAVALGEEECSIAFDLTEIRALRDILNEIIAMVENEEDEDE